MHNDKDRAKTSHYAMSGRQMSRRGRQGPWTITLPVCGGSGLQWRLSADEPPQLDPRCAGLNRESVAIGLCHVEDVPGPMSDDIYPTRMP